MQPIFNPSQNITSYSMCF